jgi:hypothetical protein
MFGENARYLTANVEMREDRAEESVFKISSACVMQPRDELVVVAHITLGFAVDGV